MATVGSYLAAGSGLTAGRSRDDVRELGGAGDTTMQLVDCANNVVMACDDDSGPGLLSLISGCLDPGAYCVRIRAFSATSTFDYSLNSTSSPGCSLPGTATGDGLYRCNDFGTCPP